MFKKSIALAVPALAAGALVAASLGGGPVQASADPQPKAAVAKHAPKAAKAVSLVKCTGGYQKAVADRGVKGYVYTANAASDTNLIGSVARFRGPRTGRDVLSVNFSTLAFAGTNYGQIKVLLDGIPMAPSDNVDGSWIYQLGEYQDFSRNYCARIGRGVHTVRVAYKTNTGGYLYLWDPMLHVEQSE